MNNIIKIENLSKHFKEVIAVDNLSFNVKKGEFFAFLGVNGAGKSTTINIMCGMLTKDKGNVLIDDLDIEKNQLEINKIIGIVYQSSCLDKYLTVYDNLLNKAALYNIKKSEAIKRINELACMFEFKDLLNRTFGKLSGGQARRIDVARALLHNPKILILDEPTTGLDPHTRKVLWHAIEKIRKENNTTILLTTHYMEEVVDADYVIIIDSGKKVAYGSVIDLKNSYANDYLTLYNVSIDDVSKLGLPYVKTHNAYRVTIENTKVVKELINKYPDIFNDFEVTKGNMDDVFLNVTGKTLEGGK